MATSRPRIGPGERAPDFALPRGAGQPVRFYGVAGGAPLALVLTGGADTADMSGLVASLREALPPEVGLHVVAGPATGAQADAFRDADAHVHASYGVATDGPPVIVVLDPNVRVVAVHQIDGGAPPLAAIARAAEDVAHRDDAAVTVRQHAPVLLVPRVLDEVLCARLLERWEVAGNVETGVEASADGTRGERPDELRKRRRDHTITDPELVRTLAAHVGRRVMPEIRKAFAYSATRFEGFKIGCYEATRHGFFDAHRDNLSPATAHRRFGLTLNLNDEYEGGELRFPEYGRQRYRPAKGEALVFSGSHLHEVLPVTAGRRFVLLSFLFGDDRAAPRRSD